MALPALQAVRAHFKDARIVFLSDRQQGRSWVGKDVLDGTGLVDRFESYTGFDKRVPRIRIFLEMARVWLNVWKGRFDAVVYLAPSLREPCQVVRDKAFFRSTGIRQLFGFSGFPPPRRRSDNGFLAHEPHEAELLLRRLAQSGIRGSATFHIPIPKPRQERAKSSMSNKRMVTANCGSQSALDPKCRLRFGRRNDLRKLCTSSLLISTCGRCVRQR